jgi:hypothetical protein
MVAIFMSLPDSVEMSFYSAGPQAIELPLEKNFSIISKNKNACL